MARLLGIDFAPFCIPISRRLQTFTLIAFYCGSFSLGPLAIGTLLWLLVTDYFWVTCVYIAWYWFDRNAQYQGGRKWRWVRRWTLWKYVRDYFPITLVKTVDIDPYRNYIFATHPHGAMTMGMAVNAGTEANNFSQLFPGLRPTLLILDGQLKVPLLRDFQMSGGACSVSRESMEWLLTKEGTGNALMLIPGGMKELNTARPGTCCLYLARRKGFCRIALKYGADLVPCLSFGENELFDDIVLEDGSLVKMFHSFCVKYLGYPLPLIHGRGIFQYTFGILPFRRPVTTVVGKPLPVTKLDCEPTQEQIDELHKEYCRVLRQFYDEEKGNYGLAHVPLVIY
ncbi:2-acylglycerol O-acyltransferase 1 [Halotydeus destructor]|nr:2-acylglycerol O-acyltransferase 1 [Halotydeus destructor]